MHIRRLKEPATHASASDVTTDEANSACSEPLNRFLRMAVMAGVESAVQIHLDRGDDLNARDGSGMTPLMLSAARNRAAISKLLLDAGADGTLLDMSGRTAYAIARAAGAREAAAILGAAQILIDPSHETDQADPGQRSAMSLVPPSAETHSASEDLGALSRCTPQVSETPIREVLGAPVALGDTSEFDVSGWEAEEDRPPPEADMEVTGAASAIQIAISDFEPIDSSAAWDDIDAYLPDQSMPLARADDTEARSRMRLLLLRAVREGSVPSMDVPDLIIAADRSSHPEAERLLNMVINDLGAEVDERFEYSTADDNFKVFVRPEETPEEEEILDAACAAIDSAASPRHEPMRMYQREFQRLKLISGQEEVALAQAMEKALSNALDALAAWPQGVERTLDVGAEIEIGLRPLAWMTLCGAEADIEKAITADAEESAPAVEEEEFAVDNSDDWPEESRPEFGDRAIFEALKRLGSLDIGADQQGLSWSSARETLAVLRLNRRFLLDLVNIESIDAHEAGVRYRQAMDAYQKARERMVGANLKLVLHLAKKYHYSGEPLDDLVQEGNMGLLKAIERYDWRLGFKFSTYATWWIRQHIGRYVADKGRAIRIPVHVYEKLQRLQRETRVLEAALRRAPNIEEIAMSMEMRVPKVELLQRWTLLTLPLDEMPGDDSIAIEARQNFVLQSPEDDVYAIELGRSIDKLLATLTQKEEKILRMRFGIGVPDALTLEEIGQCYDVTRERVRQIEGTALKKLRHSNRGGAFARTALGISGVAPKQKKVAADDDDTDLAVAGPAEIPTPCPPEAVPNLSPEVHPSFAISSSRLDQLVARAVALGVPINDDRAGRSGKVWINLVAEPDMKQRSLTRNLLEFGFKAWPGKGYWI